MNQTVNVNKLGIFADIENHPAQLEGLTFWGISPEAESCVGLGENNLYEEYCVDNACEACPIRFAMKINQIFGDN